MLFFVHNLLAKVACFKGSQRGMCVECANLVQNKVEHSQEKKLCKSQPFRFPRP